MPPKENLAKKVAVGQAKSDSKAVTKPKAETNANGSVNNSKDKPETAGAKKIVKGEGEQNVKKSDQATANAKKNNPKPNAEAKEKSKQQSAKKPTASTDFSSGSSAKNSVRDSGSVRASGSIQRADSSSNSQSISQSQSIVMRMEESAEMMREDSLEVASVGSGKSKPDHVPGIDSFETFKKNSENPQLKRQGRKPRNIPENRREQSARSTTVSAGQSSYESGSISHNSQSVNESNISAFQISKSATPTDDIDSHRKSIHWTSQRSISDGGKASIQYQHSNSNLGPRDSLLVPGALPRSRSSGELGDQIAPILPNFISAAPQKVPHSNRKLSVMTSLKIGADQTPQSAKEGVKAAFRERKSLAPDTKELNSLIAMAIRKSAEDIKLWENGPSALIKGIAEEVAKTSSSSVNRILSPESRLKWNELFRAQKWARKASVLAFNFSQALLKKVHHVPNVEDTITGYERTQELDQITKLMSIAPKDRSGDIIQSIDKILRTRIPDYAKMAESDRYHLCRIMRMERHKKETLLLWEENLLTCFHILFVGQVEIFKLNRGEKYTLTLMNTGCVIGHARAKVEGARRAAGAVLSKDCVFLVIDKDVYMGKGQKNVGKQAIDPRVLKLQKLSPFFHEMPQLFSKMAVFFEYQSWDKGDIIQEQGKQIDNLYWIVDGTCKVSRRIPFIVRTHYGKVSYNPYTPGEPFVTPATRDGGLEEKLVEVQLQTQENLEEGHWFSYIPLAPKRIQNFHFEKEDIYRYRVLYQSEYVVAADSKVNTVKITFEDFMDISNAAVIKTLDEKSDLHRFDLRMLQNQYLDQRAWDNLKKTVVDEIVKK